MFSPAEHLATLERLARTGDALPEPLAAWLVAGLRRHRAGLPLPDALGLCGPEARRCRDTAVRRAAAVLAPRGSAWRRAGIVLRELNKIHPNPDPATWPTGYRGELQRALHTGPALPRTQQGLANILQNAEIVF